jgi:cell division protein FtsQ
MMEPGVDIACIHLRMIASAVFDRPEIGCALRPRRSPGGRGVASWPRARARAGVKELPWVAEATVRKLYPHTLSVTVDERQPFALWQEGGEVSLIDREGTAIVAFEEERFAHLPLVVGAGANREAAPFLGALADHAHRALRGRAAVLVAERRWDLVLDDDLVVKLPERGAYEAMAELVELDRREAVLSREVTIVDLRLPDRLILHVPDRTAAPQPPAGPRSRARMATGPAQ